MPALIIRYSVDFASRYCFHLRQDSKVTAALQAENCRLGLQGRRANVMAGLVPAIHVFAGQHGGEDVDARHTAGHDGRWSW
jgi:hypothetical protein